MDDSATFTINEYVKLEAFSNVKHEFIEGRVLAMAGGTLEHARLAMALAVQLGAQLRGRPCAIYSSDARVRVTGRQVITYPDLAIGCGRTLTDREDPNAHLNPSVLIEVTSPATEKFDRNAKFDFYKAIPSLREYVLVSHDSHSIEVFRRLEDGSWNGGERLVSGQHAELMSISCTIDVDELYRDPRAEPS